MCRKAILGALLSLLCGGYAATATQYAYEVRFTDKNNTPYSLSSPAAYLSSRSIARRTALGIAVDSTDLPVNQTYIDSVLTLTGGKLHERSRWMNMCVILLADSTSIHALDGKAFVKDTKFIAYYAGMLHKPVTGGGSTASQAAAPAHKTTAGDALYYSNTWQQTLMVNGYYLHDHGYAGDGKLIAVLDAGFLGTDTHPAFDSMRHAGKLLDWHNFTLDTSYIYSYDDHGTKVLSTMAGDVPGTFVGSAPRASYALYVTEDGNSEQLIELDNMLCGAERADSLGADVITTSLGYDTFDNSADNFVFATDFDGKTTHAAIAANMATRKGILYVATAGNEGGGWWNMILTPGDADSALTIGSTDATALAWSTSGYGPNAAGQVKPDVCGLGHVAEICTPGGGYGGEDGTSFSTPQIAGWAACLWQANPGTTPYQIRQAIIKCASKYSAPDTHNGYGVPDFECTELLLGVPGPQIPANSWIAVAPNPFSDNISVSVSPDTNEYIDIRLMDIMGRTLSTAHQYFSKGNNSLITFPVPDVPTGMYLLQAQSPSHHEIVKLVKK